METIYFALAEANVLKPVVQLRMQVLTFRITDLQPKALLSLEWL